MVPRANGDYYCTKCHSTVRTESLAPTLFDNERRPCQEFPGYRLVRVEDYEPENVITLNKDDTRG